MDAYNTALAKRDADALKVLLEGLGIAGDDASKASLSAAVLAAARAKSFGWFLPGGQQPLGQSAAWSALVLGPKHGAAAWTRAQVEEIVSQMGARVTAIGGGVDAGGPPPRIILCAPPNHDKTDGSSRLDEVLQLSAALVGGGASFESPMLRVNARRAHNCQPPFSPQERQEILDKDAATYSAAAGIVKFAGCTAFVFDDNATSGCTLAAYCRALKTLAKVGTIICVPLCVSLERSHFTLEALEL